MILWHPNIISLLPSKLLSALHRDLCHVRSSNYASDKIFDLTLPQLGFYHYLVLIEMISRGWKPNMKWKSVLYRGKKREAYPSWFQSEIDFDSNVTLLNQHPLMLVWKFKSDLLMINVWRENHA